MTVEATLRATLALLIGFALGSVLPADLLARRRGIDIRSVGDGNPGTWNAFAGLGWGAGLITAVYDISVGVVAIQLARLLDVSEGLAYLAGIMTVVGHRFPVFRGFRGGGQGMGSTAGMLVYGVATAVFSGWLSVADVAVLIAVGAIAFAVTRSGIMVAIAMLPILVAEVFFAYTDWTFLVFMTAVAGHIWVVQAVTLRHGNRQQAARHLHGQTRH